MGAAAARVPCPGSDLSHLLLNPGISFPHSRRSTLPLLNRLGSRIIGSRIIGSRRQLASLITLLLVGVIAIGLPGCQSTGGSAAKSSGTAPNDSGQSLLQEILRSGKLRVGMTAAQPPFNMTTKSGEIVGLEVDLTTALAQSMGLEVEFVVMPFALLLEALENGQVDMVASGMTITPERNARVAFAGPYFITGKSVLTKSETLANVRSSDELDDSKLSIAALDGSTSERFVSEVLPRAKLVTTDSYDAAVQMVINDEIDAMVADHQVCILAVWRNPEVDLSALITPFTIEPLGIAIPADAPLFVNLVENYLDALEVTGLLTQFKARWLNDGYWVNEHTRY
jgi:polar amino acid transport system substrate-binding protein